MVRVNGVKRTMARVRSKLASRTPQGYSNAGRVIAVGAAVSRFAPGDLVACAGQGYAMHAEVVAVPENLVAKVPEGCDLRSASATTVASIALQGLRRADLRLGETAVVLGLGLLGQISLQLLAASGAEALGFDPDSERVAEARELGFPQCFTVSGEEAAAEVLARTGGKGADATLITAATSVPGICQDAMAMTRRKGRVVVVGAVPLQFDRDPFYRKEIDFLISTSYGPGRYDPSYEEEGHDYPFAYVRWTENRNMEALLGLMARGALRVDKLIGAEYPVAEAEEAFACLTAAGGKRPVGVVLKYDVDFSSPAAKPAPKVELPVAPKLTGKIGVGVIGTGQFFRTTHLPNLQALQDKFQIRAVCAMESASAQDIARQVGAGLACSEAGELIACPDVELVLIATRHDTHAPLAMEAIKAGKHVFTEKPMAIDPGQLDALLGVLAEHDRYFMVGFNRRFSPHAVRLRELVADRATPLVVNYRVMADPAPPDHWIYSPAGGGRVVGEVCHMLDLFGFLVGDDVEVAEVDVVAPPVGVGGPPGDSLVASLRYADGSLCTLTYTTLGKKSKENGKERVEALWQGKTFVIDDYVRSLASGCSAGSAGGRKSKGHFEELAVLADYLNGRGPLPLSVEASRRATELSFRIDALCRSAAPGCLPGEVG
jgi:predicted dehydrogenase/threonine dehydrogenase-like Zn-dependent dehydrogenase